jgi:hypothetical protein
MKDWEIVGNPSLRIRCFFGEWRPTSRIQNPFLEPDQECIPVQVPLKQRSSGSGSTTLQKIKIFIF